METERKNRPLKHLGFVRMAAIQALVCASNLYDYAKKNSGTLRSTVGTVEGAVTTVVGPVYEKLKGMPDDLLVFLDQKVTEASYFDLLLVVGFRRLLFFLFLFSFLDSLDSFHVCLES